MKTITQWFFALSGALAWVGGALSAPTDIALIREANAAYKRRDEAKLDAIIAQTKGHQLEAYPQYWAMRLRLEGVPSAQIDAFATQFPGALAQHLRMEWLNEQAKRDNWTAWTDAALLIDTDNGDFQCNRAQWQLRQGKAPANAPAALWNDRLSDACALAFAEYAKAKLVTKEDVLLRFRLLPDGATPFAARTIAEWLPAAVRPDEAQLAQAYGGAIRVLQKATVTDKNREVILYALGRLARQDVELADEAYRKLRAQLPPADRGWIALQLGVYGARQHHPDAVTWFKEVTDTRVLDSQAQWWVRAALRAGDWAEVVRATDAMSETGRGEPTWSYWRARGLAATGKIEEAHAILAKHREGFSFYNWLSAEELKTTPQTPSSTAVVPTAQLDLDSNAAALRTVALSKANLRFEAAREWFAVVKDLNDEQLIAASAWMQKQNVWDRAIGAAVRTKSAHDVKHRYVVPFSDALYGAAKIEGVEPTLIAALTRQESRFAPDVVSSAGAIGLMQLMPNTAKWVAKKLGRTYDRDALEDPEVNARFGAFYLRTVMDGLAHSPVMALAAYNAGPGRAKHWQASKPIEGAIYAETILFNETRDYVKQVMVNAMWIDRIHHGGKGPSLKARLGVVPARSSSLTLAKDTP